MISADSCNALTTARSFRSILAVSELSAKRPGTLALESSIGCFELPSGFVFDPFGTFGFVFDTELDGTWRIFLSGNNLPDGGGDAGTDGGFVAASGSVQQISDKRNIPKPGV